MKKYPSRDEMIETLSRELAEGAADNTHEGLVQDFLEIFRDGVKGYKDLSDEELQREWDERSKFLEDEDE